MTKSSPVIWSEGLFLHPQHFQQEARHWRDEMQVRLGASLVAHHGFLELELDQHLLTLGQISVIKARGFFQDGTYFSVPDKDPAPPVLQLPNHDTPTMISLAVPAPDVSAQEAGWLPNPMDEQALQLPRYTVREVEVRDTSDPDLPMEPVNVGVLNLRLLTSAQSPAGWLTLPMLDALSTADGHTDTNTQFIPACLSAFHDPVIRRHVQRVLALLESRIAQIRERTFRKSSHNSSELGDFLLLQTCLRQRLALEHLSRLKHVHPERVYAQLLDCLGDVCVHTDQLQGADFKPDYQHDALALTFEWVVDALRDSLDSIQKQGALQIPLQTKPGGVYLAHLNDPALLSNGQFILAVRADLPAELVLQRFPGSVKIGPVERLRDLVNLNLPGVRLRNLTQAPPSVPYFANHLYFQLETRGDTLWKQLESTGHLALHYAGDLPGLALQLWAMDTRGEAA